jgi:phosphatidylglycerol:prolipoprotein diacylglycerol transferase
MIALFRSLFAPPRHLILVLVALWFGLALSEKRADRQSISRDILNNLVYSSLFGYIVGGRVLFALANYSAFEASPLSLFSINIDLFDPAGALITALLVGFVYGQRQKQRWWSILDVLTPLFAILAIGLSLSNLAAGTAFGSQTDLPWGITLWNARRHPTQIYELIAALLVFAVIWFREPKSSLGSTFLSFAALTAAARLFLEAFRGDSTLVFGGLRLAQIVAWVVLALTLMAVEFTHQIEKID